MNDKDIEKVKDEKKKEDRNIYVSILAIIVLAIAFITTVQSKIEKGTKVNGKNILDEKTSDNDSCIYISGEVKNEGVVCVDKNELIAKAISEAGGVNKDADVSMIDESRKVVDGEKLHIISKDKTVKEVDSFDNKEENNIDKVNINTATKEELDKLEGIGESTANKIIEYRKNNKFESIEDLKNVSGIGDSKYDKISQKICVN